MSTQHQQIRELLDRVRSRWRRLTLFRAAVRGALAASLVLAIALFITYWTSRAPVALAALGIIALALVTGALAWGLWPIRKTPSDAQVARFIEESDPSLDDRLASAVDVLAAGHESDAPGLAAPMVADAARRASAVDPSAVVPRHILRRAGVQAAAAAVLLAAVAFFGRDTARQSYDALSLTLFPSRVALEVTPGNARVQPGTPLTIEARLVGNRAPVVARLLRADGPGSAASSEDEGWRSSEMTADASGTFRLAIESVGSSFAYRVAAGSVTSPIFDVTVVRPPRVTRIDVDYTYPSALGLPPRTEEDGGDIYAPDGTDVRVRIHTDRQASVGNLALGNGQTIVLAPLDPTTLAGTLKILEDGSYRVALSDREGLKNPGDTEYFIRMLEDRPPDVRILRPARDGSVTPLEEVEIEAQAEDDFGIDRLELVYSVRGGPEKAVPFRVPRRTSSVTGVEMLYLEDLHVQPGDFVSYYVRAKDLARGKRASETRSDIFFLEVKPFEQEFTLAQSQASGGGGNSPQLDDLVSAQKEIIVATWKLDRRTRAASGARSEADIRAVGRAEAELRVRVEETASSFRASTMRDPRAGQPRPGRGGAPPPPPPNTLRAGQTMPEEDDMTAAATAMGKAVGSLNNLKTSDALQPELDALDHLLKAQGDVKKKEVTRQQAGSGSGGNRNGQDLSSLFDKELQKEQQTNYETPTTTEQRDDTSASMLDKIKELARRQDELLKRQRDLARERERMTPEELKRELEKLTREQSDLRQRAEDLARQMTQNQSGQPDQSGKQSQAGQQNQPGQQSQPGQQPQSGQPGQGKGGSSGQSGQQMKDVSEEMRSAASELRRQDPTQASERGTRALEKLQDLQRQLQSAAPDEQRRARGDLQLEARQLADAERQLESELNRLGQGDNDGLRRAAGEQERLAERARRLEQGLGQQTGAAGDPKDSQSRTAQQAVAEAARDFERQKVDERMQRSADELRAAASQQPGKAPGPERAAATTAAAATDREAARALDKLADKLASAEGPQDGESKKLSDQLARAQELRERIDDLNRRLEKFGQAASESSSSAPSSQKSPGDTGKAGQGGGSGGAGDLAQLRQEYMRELQKAQELLDEMRREDSGFAQGGPGFTFEGQGMTLSAPGTEAFKQDYSKWDQLRKQATQALERAESSLSKKLQARESRDRLAAGVDDKPPADYQQQVDSYFKALATKKKP